MTHENHTSAAHAAPRLLRNSAWHLGALAALGCSLAWGQANAQTRDHSGNGSHEAPVITPVAASSAAADSQELSEGEVTRWDARSQKVTLRHGELKNLAMPPMTMVFKLQEASLGSQIKVGEKVRFRAEQVNGAFVVTHLEAIN